MMVGSILTFFGRERQKYSQIRIFRKEAAEIQSFQSDHTRMLHLRNLLKFHDCNAVTVKGWALSSSEAMKFCAVLCLSAYSVATDVR